MRIVTQNRLQPVTHHHFLTEFEVARHTPSLTQLIGQNGIGVARCSFSSIFVAQLGVHTSRVWLKPRRN